METVDNNNQENQTFDQGRPPPGQKKKFSAVAVGSFAAIVTVAAVLVFVAIAGSIISIPRIDVIQPIIDVRDALTLEEQDLSQIELDLNTLTEDELVLDELEQTYRDVLDEASVIATEDALNVDDINAEAADADISEDLSAFAEDDVSLDSLSPSFEEVTQ